VDVGVAAAFRAVALGVEGLAVTISHHLKVLHEAGLLDRDKRGVWVYYRARTGALASLGALIGDPRS